MRWAWATCTSIATAGRGPSNEPSRSPMPLNIVARETFRVGQPLVVDADSPAGRYATVFEDDGQTGLFYAVDTDVEDGNPVQDALLVYVAADVTDAFESGDFATDAPDSRSDPRVNVSWPARMQLPDGRIIALEVRNVSGGGVGLMSDQHIPDYTVVEFEMDVPGLDGVD